MIKPGAPFGEELTSVCHAGSRSTPAVQRLNTPQMLASEITLRLGPVAFTVESRTPVMTQIIHHHFSPEIGRPVEGSPRLVCESGFFPDKDFALRESGRTVEARSHYWILRNTGLEATYLPRYRLAWAAIPEKLPQFLTLLQMLFPLWLEGFDGMLIRGSTVVHHERSYLLLDDSALGDERADGTPKASSLFGGEISLLAQSKDGKFMAHQTPLGGNARPATKLKGAPLAEIFICSGTVAPDKAPLTGNQAFSHLYSRLLTFTEDPSRHGALRERVRRLTEHVRVRVLPNGSDIRFLTGYTEHH